MTIQQKDAVAVGLVHVSEMGPEHSHSEHHTSGMRTQSQHISHEPERTSIRSWNGLLAFCDNDLEPLEEGARQLGQSWVIVPNTIRTQTVGGA